MQNLHDDEEIQLPTMTAAEFDERLNAATERMAKENAALQEKTGLCKS